MDTLRSIKHSFDISQANVGDWFIGCLKCGYRMDFNTAAKPECPECGLRLDVFTVTETDIKNSKCKDISIMTQFVNSTSDQRTVNNVMRHAYRVLTDNEKSAMQAIKDKGLELHDLIESIGQSRELSLAKTKTEEAVMWAVKHLTR